MRIAILVLGYNKVKPLERLLNSLSNAIYPENDIPLFISLDKGYLQSIDTILDKFEWRNGSFDIIRREEHMGLRNHVIECGSKALEYDGVIILEDDLFVSKHYYQYALDALKFYNGNDNIAGISLYKPKLNFQIDHPFEAIDDGYDNYFLQIPQSWGQVWSTDQWRQFLSWYEENKNKEYTYIEGLPSFLLNWPESSWAKYFWKFMVEKNKYFVIPRISYSTQFGEMGKHSGASTNKYQNSLALQYQRCNFSKIEMSEAIYDGQFELLPDCFVKFNIFLTDFEFTVDLNGTKEIDLIDTPYMLTSRPVENSVITFGIKCKPMELNILLNIEGTELRLARTEDVKEFNIVSAAIKNSKDYLFYYRSLSLKDMIYLTIGKILYRFL